MISALSLLLGIGLIVYHLVGAKPVQGWTSVIVSLYFIGGLIIANMGLVGAYIGKIYEESKGRPPYIVAGVAGEFPTPLHHFTKPADGDATDQATESGRRYARR
jgi:hypothetical protein